MTEQNAPTHGKSAHAFMGRMLSLALNAGKVWRWHEFTEDLRTRLSTLEVGALALAALAALPDEVVRSILSKYATRAGEEWTRKFPELAEAMRKWTTRPRDEDALAKESHQYSMLECIRRVPSLEAVYGLCIWPPEDPEDAEPSFAPMPFGTSMEDLVLEAKAWAEFQPDSVIKAYALATYRAMTRESQEQFLAHVHVDREV